MTTVRYTDEFERWWNTVDATAQEDVAFVVGLLEKHGARLAMPYTKKGLKQQLYGTSHPSLHLETEVMEAAATRLSADLSVIEKLFPHGFGALVKSLQSW